MKDAFIKKVIDGDKNKEKIYKFLLKSPSSRRVAREALKLTKHQFEHYVNFLIENKYVKFKTGKCEVYGNEKVHILSANPDFVFKARTTQQLKDEEKQKKEKEAIFKKYVRVVKNLDRPGSDYAWQRKKTHTQVSIQSSFNIL